MRKLIACAALLICAFFINCTQDETVEEQVYLLKKSENQSADSGDEGDQDLDKD